jgi:hypothetical protein
MGAMTGERANATMNIPTSNGRDAVRILPVPASAKATADDTAATLRQHYASLASR